MNDYGIVSLIPTLSVLIIAVISRRTVESLMAGVVIGLLIIDPANVVTALSTTALDVLGDDFHEQRAAVVTFDVEVVAARRGLG